MQCPTSTRVIDTVRHASIKRPRHSLCNTLWFISIVDRACSGLASTAMTRIALIRCKLRVRPFMQRLRLAVCRAALCMWGAYLAFISTCETEWHWCMKCGMRADAHTTRNEVNNGVAHIAWFREKTRTQAWVFSPVMRAMLLIFVCVRVQSRWNVCRWDDNRIRASTSVSDIAYKGAMRGKEIFGRLKAGVCALLRWSRLKSAEYV